MWDVSNFIREKQKREYQKSWARRLGYRGRTEIPGVGGDQRPRSEALYLDAACSDFPASGPESWARDSKVTGMVISDDWVAGLGMGASTVSMPSGDREEETWVGSTPGGSLEHEKDKCYPPR